MLIRLKNSISYVNTLKNSINATKINKTAKNALKTKKRGSPEFCCRSERYGRRRVLVDLDPVAEVILDGRFLGWYGIPA